MTDIKPNDLQTYLTKIKELEADASPQLLADLRTLESGTDNGQRMVHYRSGEWLHSLFVYQNDKDKLATVGKIAYVYNIATELVEVALAADEVDSIGKYETIKETESKIHNLTAKLKVLKNKIAGLGEG